MKKIRFHIILLFLASVSPCFGDTGPYSGYKTEDYRYASNGYCYKLVYIQTALGGTCHKGSPNDGITGVMNHVGKIYYPSSNKEPCSNESQTRYEYEKWLTYKVPAGFCEGTMSDQPIGTAPIDAVEEYLATYYENNTVKEYPSLLTDIYPGKKINIRGGNFIVWKSNWANTLYKYNCTQKKVYAGNTNGSYPIYEWPETRSLNYAFLNIGPTSEYYKSFGDSIKRRIYRLSVFNNVPVSWTNSGECYEVSRGWYEYWYLIPIGDAVFTDTIHFTDFTNLDTTGDLIIDLPSKPCGDYTATWQSFSFLKRFDCFVENMQTTDLFGSVSASAPDLDSTIGDSSFQFETVNYGSPEFDMSIISDGLSILKYVFLIACSLGALKIITLPENEE